MNPPGRALQRSERQCQYCSEQEALDPAQGIDAWKAKNRTWQHWGAKDQLGSANLISAAKRKQAARLVREGVPISLARTIETQQAADVPSPLAHAMLATGESPDSHYSADTLCIGFHGWSHTHIDALCHPFDQGKTLYRGRLTPRGGRFAVGVGSEPI